MGYIFDGTLAGLSSLCGGMSFGRWSVAVSAPALTAKRNRPKGGRKLRPDVSSLARSVAQLALLIDFLMPAVHVPPQRKGIEGLAQGSQFRFLFLGHLRTGQHPRQRCLGRSVNAPSLAALPPLGL